MRVILDIDDKFKEEYSEYDIKMYAAIGFYKQGLMSTGDLAKLVGVSRIKFMNEMGKYGCGILDMTEEQLGMDECYE